MKEKSREELEDLEKLNEAYLYDIGAEYVNIICEEADALLEEYKDLEVPKSLDDWFYAYLEELESKERKERRRKRLVRISKRVVVAVLIIGIGLSAVTFGVEAFRIKFFNIVLETKQRFGLVSYEETVNENQTQEVPKDWNGYYPFFLPEGYYLLDYEQGTGISRLTYIDGKGIILELFQGTMGLTSQIDTENATVIEVEINGNIGVLSEKEDEVIIGWSEKHTSFLLRGNLDKSTLLQVAESIEQKK